MPEIVGPDLREARALADPGEHVVDTLVLEHRAGFRREDQPIVNPERSHPEALCGLVGSVLAEQANDVGAEGYRATAARSLRLADDQADATDPLRVTLDADRAPVEVDVDPAERLELAGPAAGVQPDGEERLPLKALGL